MSQEHPADARADEREIRALVRQAEAAWNSNDGQAYGAVFTEDCDYIGEEVIMKNQLAMWTLIALCFSMAGAIGGGLYEHIVLTPLWSASPPASFAIIQPGTGVPLQTFWIPVHGAITIFMILALLASWKERKVRRLLLAGLASYIVMRAWSGLFFIPEMLAFQQVPLDSPPSAELMARVQGWTFWTWFREPLDILSFVCFVLAVFWLKRPEGLASAGTYSTSASGEIHA